MTPHPNKPAASSQVAALLLIPAVLISVAACLLIPWMLETKRRLQNDYWEAQLTFATVAVSIAAAGMPFLLLRLLCSKTAVAIGSWLVVLTGYLAVFTYVLQSHFPVVSKVMIAAAAGALAILAGCALSGDLKRTRRGI